METQDGSEIAASPDLMAGYNHEVHSEGSAEPAHAEASELSAIVADLEASLGDSFPQAQPAAAQPHDTQPLPGWPVAPAPKRAAAPAAARTSVPEPEPVANTEIEIPAALAASAGVAATVAAPAMSYSPAPVRPLGAGA